ncbi:MULTISPECIES: sugar ABC transporter permease [Vibrio]|uniref:Sugar ABC transporter permease n=2 Tax=Vibrio TaxID=662 RepID=A0A241TAK0_9VIBR|nr:MULTISPECIES: sugar ABC transporter permease [Vibrio]ASI91985.1 sugar ABC transporter permease [Vibrio mediterranei]AYV23425.1 sugar ABC transporter permease [Vibrio mediterranei]EDL54078.1 putative binding-protein dependent transport protein [Vibrio mediterranei AK1]KFA98334.1 sugar ABC transporter permease [Vibrio sp. ER1A]MCF4172369.1 sugar ABC transporter permease [Vibrio sp. McD22-P3]
MTPLERAEARFGWKLVAPTIGIIGLLILYPIVFNVYLSFFDVKLNGDKTFVGIANYARLLANPDYYSSIATTGIYLFGTVAGTTLLGLAVALLMRNPFRGRGLVSAAILMPYFAPVISVVFGWQFLFDPVNGVFNWLMVDVLHIWNQRTNLIGEPGSAVWVVIIFDVWKHFPIAYLLILSKLTSIPKDQYEAAAIDGYGPIGRFFHVTLPEIYFVLATVVILRLIWNLNRFEDVFLLAPNVQTLPVFTYYQAFTGVIDQGLAAATSVIQFSVLCVLIWFYVKKILKW